MFDVHDGFVFDGFGSASELQGCYGLFKVRFMGTTDCDQGSFVIPTQTFLEQSSEFRVSVRNVRSVGCQSFDHKAESREG